MIVMRLIVVLGVRELLIDARMSSRARHNRFVAGTGLGMGIVMGIIMRIVRVSFRRLGRNDQRT